MPPFKDLAGKQFGRLVVLDLSHRDKRGAAYWNVRCECGATKKVRSDSLTRGNTESCGCLSAELAGKRMFRDLSGRRFGPLLVKSQFRTEDGRSCWIVECSLCGSEKEMRSDYIPHAKSCGCENPSVDGHGMRNTPEYGVWDAMIQRCTNLNHASYHVYGGRGITVCNRWRDFSKFFEDMGKRPSPKHTIERVDNNAGYRPENCRWATRHEQMRNTRRNRFITFNNETMCLIDWAKKTGIHYVTIHNRLGKLGWSIERALTTPVRKTRRSKTHVNDPAT